MALLTLLGLLFNLALNAATVSSDRAVAVVQGWLKLDPVPVGEPLGATIGGVEAFNDSKGKPLYYVVTLQPTGFAMVAAEDRVEPIVAFSRTGRFDHSLGNPLAELADNDLAERLASVRNSLRAGVGGGAAMVKWARLNQAAAASGEPGPSAPSDVRVAPFIGSHWSQDTAGGVACYNYYTPKGPSGNINNYPCGCVATAMAQIMRYHRFPVRAVGTPAFQITVDGLSATARLRGGNGAGGAYVWDNMPLDPRTPTVAQRQAIGALTYDAGVASLMEYLPAVSGGSGAYLQDTTSAYVDAFGYSNAIYGDGSQANSGALNTMINPNLDARLPVLLGIAGAQADGHAVVCDGYGYSVSTLYHHLNMGWAGNEDAWYALPEIDTANGTFTSVPDLIYNIFPSGTGEIVSGRVFENTGRPIPNATVTVMNGGGAYYWASTDTNGVYAVTGVVANAQFAVSVNCVGYFPTNGGCATGRSLSGTGSSGNAWGVNFALVRMGPPVIETQPASQTLSEGARAVLTAMVAGQAPLSYSWYRDGVPIPGATNSIYVYDNVRLSDSGAQFYCVATNLLGRATTRPAVLTVSQLLVDHFSWAAIASPQATNNPFEVAITAVDALGSTVSNFNGSVTLSGTGWTGRALFSDGFESGSLAAWSNEGGDYVREISSVSAVGASSLSLTGGTGTNSYDGVQHAFPNPVKPDRITFHVCSSAADAAAAYVVIGATKFRTNSVAHFRMNNDGTMGLTDGAVQWHAVPYQPNRWYKIALDLHWDSRTVDYYVDDSLVSAQVSFCNSNVTGISVINLYNVDYAQAWWDQIDFWSTTGTQSAEITPMALSGFNNGAWSGPVTVFDFATNLVLRADDGQGHSGTSNPFAVDGAPEAPPVITVQPVDQRVTVGGDATFNVGVSGPPPMTFAWTRNGQPIAGEHGTNYTLHDVALSDSQSRFECTARNAAGSASSVAAQLIVATTNHVRVAIVSADGVNLNNDVKSKLVETGLLDSSDVDVLSVYNSPVPDLNTLRRYAAVLTFSRSKYSDAVQLGNVLADYVDAGGAVILACDALSSVSGYGIAGRLAAGGYLPVTAGAIEPPANSSLPDMTMVMDLPGHPLLNGVKSFNNGMTGNRDQISLASGATQVAHWSTLEPLVAFKETGGNRVVALNFYPPSNDIVSGDWYANTDGGLLMANAFHWASRDGAQMPPSITMQPASQLVPPGGTATFTAECSGAAPLAFQWQKGTVSLLNGPGVAGASSLTLTLTGVGALDVGDYSVVISNRFGSVTSTPAPLTVLAPPSIEVQPSNLVAGAGGRVTLRVNASGSEPLRYQWFKNSAKLTNKGAVSGANAAALTLTGVGSVDSGSYAVVVSNFFGAVTSQVAVLTVVAKPIVLAQPASRTNGVGTVAVFTVAAQGDPLSFQWRLGTNLLIDGTGISGAQSQTLTVNTVMPSEAGDYSVLVSNVAGWVASKSARLTVIYAPTIPVPLADQTVAFGSNASFRVIPSGTAPLTYRWFKDGMRLNDVAGKVVGTGTSNLLIRSAGGSDPGVYSVLVSNLAGTLVSGGAKLRVGPSLAIGGPTPAVVLTNNQRVITGVAADAGGPGLSRVLWQLNGQGVQSADGLSNWAARVALPPGTNVFGVKSIDLDGLESPVAYRTLIYNPFAALAGSYNGLFSEVDGPRPGRAGLITLSVSSLGSFTGKIYVGGTSSSISGKFDLTGHSHFVAAALGVAVDLSLDLAVGQIGGQVSTPSWFASVSGRQANYSAAKPLTYTLALSNTNEAGPPGDGFATVTVSARGAVTLAGRFADDTPLLPVSTSMNADGTWPLYGAFYGSNGVVIGWANAQSGGVTGNLDWVKPAKVGTNFMGGFTNQLDAVGSVLPVGSRLLHWTNGVAVLSGGGLSDSITNRVTFGAGNSITVVAGQTNGLTLSVNATTGQVTGSFLDPVTGRKLPIKGVILNQQDEALGYFMAPQPGEFLLRAEGEIAR